jgi:DUF2945 family protein
MAKVRHHPEHHEESARRGRVSAAMATRFSKGDRVRWDAGNESSVGTVEEIITGDTEAGGRTVRASEDEPQYLVRSEKSGRTAVHRPESIHPA